MIRKLTTNYRSDMHTVVNGRAVMNGDVLIHDETRTTGSKELVSIRFIGLMFL